MAESGGDLIRWLHVSDFHLKAPTPGEEVPYSAGVVLNALIRAFEDGGLLADRRPDLLFCTGDVAYFGKAEEYDVARLLFHRLLKATDVTIDRAFVVPGNHDLDRDRTHPFAPKEFPDCESVDRAFQGVQGREALFGPFREFARFHEELLEVSLSSGRPFLAEFAEVAGASIGVLGLNTSWLAHRDEVNGSLVMSERLVRDALKELRRDGDQRPALVVALMHHPFDWLCDFERKAVRDILLGACDVILYGHEHLDSPSEVREPAGQAMIAGTGAAFQGRRWRNSALLCEADLARRTVDVQAIVFDEMGEGIWRTDPVLAPMRGGVFSIALPPLAGLEEEEVRPAEPGGVPEFYLRRVAAETRWVDLLGISTRGNTTQVRLDEVYVPLKTPAMHEVPEAERRRVDVDHAARDIRRVVAETPFLVLIGNPGAGKTTLLRFLAHHLAAVRRDAEDGRGRLCLEPEDPVPWPVLISLKALSALLPAPDRPVFAETLGEVLEEWARKEALGLPPGFLAREFLERRVALLLDGLDEIPDEPHRAQAVEAVRKAARVLAEKDGPGWILVTSRPPAYEGRCCLEEPFSDARILDLEPEDVERFLTLWMRAVYRVPADSPLADHPDAETELRSLQAAIRQNAAIREQSRSPVLLTVLALVHRTRGRLPAQRAVLYDEAVDVILRRFRDHPRWKIRAVREHLAAVAWELMDSATPVKLNEEADRGAVVETIARRIAGLAPQAPATNIPPEARDEAADLLEVQELQAGLLLAPDSRSCRFAHRTFQEFLAAWQLCGLAEPELFSHYATHLAEASWRETLALGAGLLAKESSLRVGRLLDHLVGDPGTPLVERAPGVAVAMTLMTDVVQFDVDPAVLDPIRRETEGLMALLEDGETGLRTRIGVGEALGRVGDPRLREEKRWVLVPAGPFIKGEGEAEKQVDLPTFEIQRWPTTTEEYRRFVEDHGYAIPRYWSEPGWAWRLRELAEAPSDWDWQLTLTPNHPVVGVSFYEAQAYCRWLEARLPMEMEWEKSARGGLVLQGDRRNPAPRRKYPWGDEEPDESRANTREAGIGGTTPVGCFPAGHGPYRTWDQAGNVFEWCEDQIGDGLRVVRGGCFDDSAGSARSAYRGGPLPGRRRGLLGFRPARSVTP